jgi:hypothetical protein
VSTANVQRIDAWAREDLEAWLGMMDATVVWVPAPVVPERVPGG